MMRKDETIKNRPLHELLNYDDDDRIVARTQFEIDEGQMSFSTIGGNSVDSLVELKRRWPILLITSALVLIVSISACTVGLIMLGPHLDHFRRSNMGGEQGLSSRDISEVSAEIENLRQSSMLGNLDVGAVASDHPVCSALGNHIMNVDHGNVVDAAVATALCLGIANPASSGLGGGMFMLIHIDENARDYNVNKRFMPEFIDARDPTTARVDENGKTTVVIDAREAAPMDSHRDMFDGKPPEASTVGGRAIAVPGELKGLELAHALYGKLDWAHLVDTAIKLAKNGVPVSAYLAESIIKHIGPRWDRYSMTRQLLSKGGKGLEVLEEHDIIKNEKLAAFLRSVKTEGAGALYFGSHTGQFLSNVNESGGNMTADDLKNYRAIVRSPLVAKDVFGFTMVGVPPPSSGGATVIGAARFLSGYDKEDNEKHDRNNPPNRKHRLVEAMRHAFAIRMSLSDPAFNTKIVEDAVNDLVYNDYMEYLRKSTSEVTTLPVSHYGGIKWAQLKNTDALNDINSIAEGDTRRLDPEEQSRMLRDFGYLDDKGTSHFSIMDNKGNSVSVTSSLNTYFGSGVLSGNTGILLNSQMDDFASPGRPNSYGVEPSESNYIEPGKRPLSSMSPTLVFHPRYSSSKNPSLGDPFMSLGASGGPKIISATLQAFLNHAVEHMDLFKAVASPRLHDQLLYHSKIATLYESISVQGVSIEVSGKTQLELETTGHTLVPINYAGCVQVVARDRITRKFSAMSDIRKGGRPSGL